MEKASSQTSTSETPPARSLTWKDLVNPGIPEGFKTIAEIAEEAGVSKSHAHEILALLWAEGKVERQVKGNTYYYKIKE